MFCSICIRIFPVQTRNSTLRYEIASKLNFQFFRKSASKEFEYSISELDEIELDNFLRQNFALSIISNTQPWLIEPCLIQTY